MRTNKMLDQVRRVALPYPAPLNNIGHQGHEQRTLWCLIKMNNVNGDGDICYVSVTL